MNYGSSPTPPPTDRPLSKERREKGLTYGAKALGIKGTNTQETGLDPGTDSLIFWMAPARLIAVVSGHSDHPLRNNTMRYYYREMAGTFIIFDRQTGDRVCTVEKNYLYEILDLLNK